MYSLVTESFDKKAIYPLQKRKPNRSTLNLT